MPLDGWDNEFVYTSDGNDYEIMSLGADGMEGGTELDATFPPTMSAEQARRGFTLMN